MKIIWKLIIIFIAVGLILAIIGLVMGASRTLFVDRRGVHIGDGTISTVTESNLAPFNSIIIDVGFSDIEFYDSDSFGIDLNGRDIEWDWSLENGVLRITHDKNTRLQILNLDFFDDFKNHVKVYLPMNSDLDVINVNSNSGDITLGSLRANRLEVSSSFGDIDLKDITSDHLQVTISSGRFTGSGLQTQNLIFNNRFGDGRFQSVRADYLKADSGSGSLVFTNCEFGDVTITNNFGDITATGSSFQRSNIRANSGSIKINGDLSGESIIHAGFGNIDLTLTREKEDFSYDITVRFGDITFDGQRLRDQTALTSGTTLENHLRLSSSSGDIKVIFGG